MRGRDHHSDGLTTELLRSEGREKSNAVDDGVEQVAKDIDVSGWDAGGMEGGVEVKPTPSF